MVEDTHGESCLGQLLIGHEAVWLETFVLCRAHTREVHAVLGLPVMLLKVAQVMSHHHYIRAPFLLQADEHTHADGVNACHTHAVETVAAPLKLALHATWVVELVVLVVVGLLETDYAVHTMVGEGLVILSRERHHLNLHVREILLGDVDCLGKIRGASLGWVLARNEKDVLEWSQLLDCLVLVLNLLWSEAGTSHRILTMETAIHAGVGA